MNTSTYAAEEWIWISRSQAEDWIQKEGGWPFHNVTIDQLYYLADALSIKKPISLFLSVYGTITPSLGIFFTVLLIGTLWRKAFQEKNTFFAVTMLIALLDLIFNIFDTIVSICHKRWVTTGYWNKWAMWFIVVLRGATYSVSLASDICALCVTLERYVAITKPHFHRNLSTTNKKLIWSIALVVTFLIGFCRMHYSLSIRVEPAGDIYMFTTSPWSGTDFVVGLATFSDTIMPTALVIVTLTLSTKLRLAIRKRQKSKKVQIKVNVVSPQNQLRMASCRAQSIEEGEASNQAENPNNVTQKAAILLTYVLDVFLILDNLGYCMYFVADMMVARATVSFQSTYDELEAYCRAQRLEIWVGMILTVLECMTRAANFPVYIALSGSMRQEFKGFVKSILKI